MVPGGVQMIAVLFVVAFILAVVGWMGIEIYCHLCW